MNRLTVCFAGAGVYDHYVPAAISPPSCKGLSI